MVVLRPDRVSLVGSALAGVTSVVVDRRAERFVEEWGDGGAHCVFADAAEVRVRITLVRAVGVDDDDALRPGMRGELVFETTSGATDAGRRVWRAEVVIVSVEHDVRAGAVAGAGTLPGAGAGVRQRVVMAAISPDGAADPLVLEEG